MDEILSGMSQSRNVFEDKSGSFNDYKIFMTIGELKSEIFNLKKGQISKLEEQITDIRTENRHIRQHCEDQISGMQQETEEGKKLHTAMEELQQETERREKEWEEKTARMQSETEELRRALHELQEQKKAVKEFIGILNTSVEKLKPEVENLIQQNRDLKQEFDKLNKRMDGIENFFAGFSFGNNDLFRPPKRTPDYYSKEDE